MDHLALIHLELAGRELDGSRAAGFSPGLRGHQAGNALGQLAAGICRGAGQVGDVVLLGADADRFASGAVSSTWSSTTMHSSPRLAAIASRDCWTVASVSCTLTGSRGANANRRQGVGVERYA